MLSNFNRGMGLIARFTGEASPGGGAISRSADRVIVPLPHSVIEDGFDSCKTRPHRCAASWDSRQIKIINRLNKSCVHEIFGVNDGVKDAGAVTSHLVQVRMRCRSGACFDVTMPVYPSRLSLSRIMTSGASPSPCTAKLSIEPKRWSRSSSAAVIYVSSARIRTARASG